MTSLAANYELDHQSSEENLFETTKSEYIYVNDGNSNVYTSNLIIWNSNSLQGFDPTKRLLISESKSVIPYTWIVNITGGTFDATSVNNKFACSLKNNYSLLDRLYLGLGTAQDISNSSSVNRCMYINEQFKRLNPVELQIVGEHKGVAFDNADSYNLLTNNAGDYTEINNYTASSSSVLTDRFVNDAIFKRNNKFVLSQTAGYSILDSQGKTLYNNSGNVENIIDQDNLTTYTSQFIPHCIVTSTQIIFHDVITYDLADIHDFFKQLNTPLAKIDNFNFKLGLNSCTTTVKYADVGTVTAGLSIATDAANYVSYKPVSFTYNSNSGAVNPFLIASAGNSSMFGDGLVFKQTTAGTPVTISISGGVGWNVGINGALTSNIPCRLEIPQIDISPKLMREIDDNPIKRVLFHDYYFDTTLTNVPGGTTINKLFTQTVQRPTRLFIIPFLSATQSATNPYPSYQSPICSAPVVCSHLRLRDMQVKVGGTNVFNNEFVKYSWQVYDLINYAMLNDKTGNAVNSLYKSGVISKKDFGKCYNVFCCDLKTSPYEEEWDKGKQINFQGYVDAKSSIKYDFFVMIEYQKQIDLNVVNSEVGKSGNAA